MAVLCSIQVSLPKVLGEADAELEINQQWTTSFAKEHVSGPVMLSREHLTGDGQADTVHHGGPDKAVLAYSVEHYSGWRDEYPLIPWEDGAFGENFTISGLNEDRVSIGDVFRIGGIVVQVSQPRIPCWKISRRWKTEGLTERVRETGRTGWYLRVLQEGQVEAGQKVEVLERPNPSLTVRQANDLLTKRLVDPEIARTYAECPELAEVWRQILQGYL